AEPFGSVTSDATAWRLLAAPPPAPPPAPDGHVKSSSDPQFIDRVRHVVRLYLGPPEPSPAERATARGRSGRWWAGVVAGPTTRDAWPAWERGPPVARRVGRTLRGQACRLRAGWVAAQGGGDISHGFVQVWEDHVHGVLRVRVAA